MLWLCVSLAKLEFGPRIIRNLAHFRLLSHKPLVVVKEREICMASLQNQEGIAMMSVQGAGARKQLRLSTKGRKRKLFARKPDDHSLIRAPGEVYSEDVPLPSGITNPASNCYLNATLQCLFNLPQIQAIAREMHRAHPEKCDTTCSTMSMWTNND